MARDVFSIISLEFWKEEVNVPWEKTKRRPVDMTIPRSMSRQNLSINRT